MNILCKIENRKIGYENPLEQNKTEILFNVNRQNSYIRNTWKEITRYESRQETRIAGSKRERLKNE